MTSNAISTAQDADVATPAAGQVPAVANNAQYNSKRI